MKTSIKVLTRNNGSEKKSVQPYRLWSDAGVKVLGPLAKPVGYVLNTVGDLLRIQGNIC
jgi:hypothetical protein